MAGAGRRAVSEFVLLRGPAGRRRGRRRAMEVLRRTVRRGAPGGLGAAPPPAGRTLLIRQKFRALDLGQGRVDLSAMNMTPSDVDQVCHDIGENFERIVDFACLDNPGLGGAGFSRICATLFGKAPLLLNATLSNLSCGDTGAAAVGAALDQRTTCLRLDLANNDITSGGAEALCAQLHRACLETLLLGANQVGDDGAKSIARAVRGSAVRHLDLSSNEISDAGAVGLAMELRHAKHLRSLRIGGNSIGEIGGTALGALRDAKALEHLDLKDNDLGAGGAAALTRQLAASGVRSLDLRGNGIGDAGAKEVLAALSDSSVEAIFMDGPERVGVGVGVEGPAEGEAPEEGVGEAPGEPWPWTRAGAAWVRAGGAARAARAAPAS